MKAVPRYLNEDIAQLRIYQVEDELNEDKVDGHNTSSQLNKKN